MRTLLLTGAALCLLAAPLPAQSTLSVVVMDPLAAPLSCPCVKGYAQRKYEALAKHLEKQLSREVRLTFAESLKVALKGDAKDEAHVIIGKHSVVLADAAEVERRVRPVASLTGKDGLTTQTGLIVVPAGDAAQRVVDLQGYRMLFGPADSDEKHKAAIALLRSQGVEWQGQIETCQACSDGATKILELGDDIRAAAVISSYAQPLLQGCGTIKKGDLRVVGETKPVPFVTAFVDRGLSAQEQSAVQDALLEVGAHPPLCQALETLVGFLPWEEPEQAPQPQRGRKRRQRRDKRAAEQAAGPAKKK